MPFSSGRSSLARSRRATGPTKRPVAWSQLVATTWTVMAHRDTTGHAALLHLRFRSYNVPRSCWQGHISMRVRQPPDPRPPASHENTAAAVFRERSAARACPHPPITMPAAAPRRITRNAPIRICPKRATARALAAAVQRPAPFHAPPDRSQNICPKRAVAALMASRPSAPFGAPPSRPRGICPNRHPAHEYRATPRRPPLARPAP
jgi:hypothetical protein